MVNIEGHSIELVCEMAGIKISMGKNKRLYVRTRSLPTTSGTARNTLALLADALEEIPNNNSGICIFGDLNVNQAHTIT